MGLFKQCFGSVVALILTCLAVSAAAQVSTGTAFSVAPGLLITNHHIIKGCGSVDIISPDGRRSGAIVDADAQIDLALLHAAGIKGATARLRSPRQVRLGESVMVFGFPLAGSLTSGGNFTSGLVSGLRGLRDAAGEIQITAPVQPGNSGGPVMDASGLVIGVVQAKLDALHSAITTGDIPQNINFAISLEVLADFLAKNRVPFRDATVAAALDTARVAELAQSFTYRVECRGKSQQAAASPGAKPKPPAVGAPSRAFKDCAECPEMVPIPAGRFVMGTAPGEVEREKLSEQFRNRSQPQYWVNVASFAAGRYEVTRGQYRAFAEATGRSSEGCRGWTGSKFERDLSKDWRNPGYAQDDTHPVACVSWEDASAYAAWLSQKTGKDYRLLSEAEWEYAARADTTTTRFWGDDGDMSCGYANGADLTAKAQVPGFDKFVLANCNDRYAYTAPIGSYRANAFGLHDMLGNVWEWTQDCWNVNYNGAPTDGSAWMTGNCSQRVVRGGSWFSDPQNLRAADRDRSTTANWVVNLGLRVARTD